MSAPYDIVERLIDKYGLADVLLMMSDVCGAKAEHVYASYQDEALERDWNNAGKNIRFIVRKLPKVPGIK